MSVRYKFGPQIVGTYARPVVAGELPDVEVTASVTSVAAGDPGEVDVDVTFVVPAYDPTAFNPLVELHAIAFATGHGIPTDPTLAIAAAQPKGSADASGHTAGGDLVVTIPGADAGGLTIVTVLGFADATPTPVVSG